MSVTIINGSALALPLPDDSVDLVVTSPPYFGLRNYTDDGNPMTHQVGAEATPDEYVDALIAATRECVRVLKNSGSLWVNLGDKYAQPGKGERNRNGIGSTTVQHNVGVARNVSAVGQHYGVPGKSLLGLPWRYALRCIDELGLILRAEVVWSKPNGLPESVRDRVRRSHEQWFHFTLRPNYYANVDEVREEYAPGMTERARRYAGRDVVTGAYSEESGRGDSSPQAGNLGFNRDGGNPLGKLPGSVWTIATQPLRVPADLGIDHFAAFPMEFPRRIITGWSPPGVCTACGEGRRAVADVTHTVLDTLPDRRAMNTAEGVENNRVHTVDRGRRSASRTVTGYACACPTPDAPTRPAVVLDPFGGTGTTALVADVLGRDGITVDLSADYCRLAAWRTADPQQRARVLKARAPMKNTAPAQAGNPPERNTMPSKMSDARLLTSYTRAKESLAAVDRKVVKAQSTLENLDQIKADAQAVIDNADGDRQELRSQLDYLRKIGANRGLDLDAPAAQDLGVPEPDAVPVPGPYS